MSNAVQEEFKVDVRKYTKLGLYLGSLWNSSWFLLHVTVDISFLLKNELMILKCMSLIRYESINIFEVKIQENCLHNLFDDADKYYSV